MDEYSALSPLSQRMLLRPRAECCPAGFSPAPCRGCDTRTQQCQQFVPTNCQCPYNICVNISSSSSGSSSGSGSGVLGGALGGVLGALAIAVALFLFWRQKRQRAKLLQARVQADAKVRAAAAEKFRPGRDGAASATGSISRTNRPVSENSSKRSARLSAGPPTITTTAPTAAGATGPGVPRPLSASDPFADPDDEDTEWTELRADGLTTFKKGGENAEDIEEEEMLDGLGALVNRRHSTGAATHLSRITEGVEEDEDAERRSLAPTIRSTMFMSKAPPMPADAISIAQAAAGISAPNSLRPLSGISNTAATSHSGGHDPSTPTLTVTSAALAPPTNNHRLSTLTTATGLSMASSIGDFVISSPNSVSSHGGARRVQLAQSRPQLVRTPSTANRHRDHDDGSSLADSASALSRDGGRSAHVDDELSESVSGGGH